jgi:O-antigen/teichoic acid export membrane protein
MRDPKQLLFKNIVSNWAAFAIGIAITFFLSPFLVHTLGKEDYGIWALVFSIISYTNLLDAGMKQSLARYIPKYYANREYDKINEVLNTGNLIYGITGTLVIVATFIIAVFFTGFFKVPGESLSMMRTALILIGIDQAIMFYFMCGTAIGPFHRYDMSNLIGIIVSVLHAGAVFLLLSMGYGIITLAIITLLTNLLRHMVRRWYQQHLVPQIRMDLRYARRAMVKELLNYGFISFFIVAGWMVIFQTGNIVIGLFVSATAVTYFNIAATLVNYLRLLVGAIGVPLVPAVSHIDALGDLTQISALYARLTRYLFYLTTSICAVTFLFGARFIYTWMGPEFTPTVNVLHILILPVCIYLPQIIANSVLLGIGRHKALFYILVVEAILNLGLSLALVGPLGIYGVALATAVVQLAIYTYIFPYMFHKLIKAELKLFFVNSAKMIVAASLFTVPVGLLLRWLNPLQGWPGLIIDGAIMAISTSTGFWFTALTPNDRLRIIGKYRKKSVAADLTANT